MTGKLSYPRVLIVTMGRINLCDSDNNGLLLRNLFGSWPRENLAQIYSGGNNGDTGFFKFYYNLRPADRFLGSVFFRFKSEITSANVKKDESPALSSLKKFSLHYLIKRLLIDTGLYELIFVPRISKQMKEWVYKFNPDIIFAQGYNLTFSRLPVQLKNITNAKLAFFCSDDWPTYIYSGLFGEPPLFRWFVRQIVSNVVSHLLNATDIPLAFGQPMAQEYEKRYNKKFTVLSHADNPHRFESANPIRVHPEGIITLMAVGTFNRYRCPLLVDVNESCRLLNDRGINIRIAVLSSLIAPDWINQLSKMKFIDIFDDPGNDLLPSYLKGADLLLLAEGFDEGFVSAIRLSISSKAHLFMFSKKPIVVYAHPDTGIAKYALKYEWAQVVGKRDINLLAETLRTLLKPANDDKTLINAAEIVSAFHSHDVNQKKLFDSLICCNNLK